MNIIWKDKSGNFTPVIGRAITEGEELEVADHVGELVVRSGLADEVKPKVKLTKKEEMTDESGSTE